MKKGFEGQPRIHKSGHAQVAFVTIGKLVPFLMMSDTDRLLRSPLRILVMQLCPIGDTIFGTPALRALRLRFPDAEITSMTWQSSGGVLKDNPNIDRLVTCLNALDAARVIRVLKNEEFHLVIGLSQVGSILSAAFPKALKVGFNSRRLGWLYAESVPDMRDIHAIDYCLRVVNSLGAPTESRRLEISISDDDERAVSDFLTSHHVGQWERLVAIHPGGKHFTAKRWSVDGFAKVADGLIDEMGLKVVIVGGSDDVSLADEIASSMSNIPLIAAGQLSLRQTAALIKRCRLFIGNDSAPSHLASAVDVPVVALFGPTDPQNFGPTSSRYRVVRAGLPCSPCFHWMASPLQYLYLSSVKRLECKHECMSEIRPEDVLSAAASLLEQEADNDRAAVH